MDHQSISYTQNNRGFTFYNTLFPYKDKTLLTNHVTLSRAWSNNTRLNSFTSLTPDWLRVWQVTGDWLLAQTATGPTGEDDGQSAHRVGVTTQTSIGPYSESTLQNKSNTTCKVEKWFPILGSGPQVGSPNGFVGSPDFFLTKLSIIQYKCVQCTFIKWQFKTFLIPNRPHCQILSKKQVKVVKIDNL